MGKKFSDIAAVDVSLIKLSLAAFDWASYCEKTIAAKMTCALDWVRGAESICFHGFWQGSWSEGGDFGFSFA